MERTNLTCSAAAAAERRPPRQQSGPLDTLADALQGPHHQIRNVRVGGRRTTLRLERVFWQALDELCRRDKADLDQLLTALDRLRGSQGLTGVVRCYVLLHWQRAARG